MIDVYLSTNEYRLTLKDELGVVVTGAVVTLTLLNGIAPSSPAVTGAAWPVTVTGEGAGVYLWTRPPAVALVPGKTYLAVSNATFAGVTAHNEVKVICQRDST